jgi:polar amino acid transport system substrate-binding protein
VKNLKIKKFMAIILGTLILCSCSQSGAAIDTGADGVLTYDDFYGKRFSILVGSIFDEVADEHFAPREKLYFNNVVEEIEAVKLGKTDAALLDNTAAAQSLESGAYPELTAIDVPIEGLDLPYGVFSTKQDIIDKYNAFLAEIEADGTLSQMQDRWLTSYALEAQMPDIKMPENPSGTLTVAIMATYAPFTFLGQGGEFMGFDIEQMKRFADYMNMDVEFVDMDFGALLPYVASGKADIGGSVYATAERKEAFIFGNPDYVSKTVLVVKKPQAN